ICPRLPNQEFNEPLSNEEIVSFVKELGYKGDIGSITEGIFYKKNVDFVELIWEDFMFQIDNRDSSAKRYENMPYPRFTKAIIQHLISKDKSISMRNRMFMHIVRDDSVLGTLRFVAKSEDNQVYGALIPAVMINQKIQNSNSYKTYLAFATGAATPKKAWKWKKPASPSMKQNLFITEEPAKKPVARRQPTGVQIRDTPGVSVSKKKAPAKAERNKGIDLLSEAALLEEDQMKKAIQRRKHETHMHQEGGSGVPDVSKADSSDSEYESWGVSDDDDDDDEQSDDERIESDVQHEVPSIQTSALLTVLVTVIPEPSVIKPFVIVTAAPATTIPLILPPFFSTL
ncbi:hypothetical protein Tco_1476005, partial [Tanacetum coccineum]